MRFLGYVFICMFFSFSLYALEFKKCKVQTENILKKWSSQNHWKTDINKFTHYTPSHLLGSWIFYTSEKKNIVISKEDQKSKVTITLAKTDCTSSFNIFQKLQSKKRTLAVTDKELIALTYKKTGLIYIWSPHMPLSFQALTSIEKYKSKNQDLETIILVDPNSKINKLKQKVPLKWLNKADSFELKMRQAYIHYPTILFFKDGKILNRVKYGFESFKNYQHYFNSILK